MLKVVVVLLIGIVSISSASIFIKFCDDVPAIMISTYRLVIASLILIAACRIRKVPLLSLDKKMYVWGMWSGLFLALHFITWISSLKYTSVASSVVLVDTNPIFVGIFSYLFLREKQSFELVAGIILSFIGSFILAFGDSEISQMLVLNKQALLGDGLALAGAIAGSGYLIIGSKMRETLDILTYITIVYTYAAIFLLLTSLCAGLSFTGYKPSSYLFMVLLAIIPQLFGHSSFNWALKHLKTSMVAITILGEPICASFLAYLILKETIGSYQFTGILLIFIAILVASRKGKKKEE